MNFTIVGGIALDSISVAGGEPHECLGGSAVYAGLAASLIGNVAVVGAIGDDIEVGEYLKILTERPSVNLRIHTLAGKTTRFRCDYDSRFKYRTTLCFSPGVAANSNLAILCPGATDVLFLASGPPEIQLSVLKAVKPRISAVDTIDHWIVNNREDLANLLTNVNIVLMSADEICDFTGRDQIPNAAAAILRCGPQLVCVKQGEFGAQLFADGFRLALPAFGTRTVDPTGAGDTFAGAFLAYLAKQGSDARDPFAAGEALVLATAISSICIEEFGTGALASATMREVSRRCSALLDSVSMRMPRL